ncbi:rhomboid family intramembrane serine protease [Actinomadura parmotrematis]|uniref:Rhomboid family intramembrane serine protease n=1 Tax=Actinomadura parmotrematis TaxID=2864039 RepID=A0ABS7FN49_9ACTN|nr:rhomboid family intramembrane serine protease [Actinomadura parmotrematis]MBW8481813.1 rhomboid family intramembrane serine protease [Actinomadura parmotrematis]
MTTEQPPEHPPAPETAAPTCYRHPGRETYVRCTRCDRPICPDCMREAAVGHQCVECVAAGRKSVRQPRTALGARAARRSAPVVTYTLIGLCVLAYLAEIASDRVVDDFAMIGLVRDRAGLPVPGIGVAEGEWYRLFTSMFLHQPPTGGPFGITHILFNMWALWAVGPQLEQVLGRWRFLALYLLSGLGGSVLLYLVAPGTAAVGASGAIFGLFGAFFVIGRKLGIPSGPILFVVGLNLVITFGAGSAISWQAHIGGLVVGLVLAAVFAYAPAKSRQAVQIAGVAAMTVLLAALVAVKTVQLV